jgi:hypothetical protein
MLNTTAQVTVADIYGRPIENLGTRLGRRQQFTEFRFVRGNEMFLRLDGEVTTHDPASTHRFGGPRLIITERQLRRFIFTETGEERVPATGEWYMTPSGGYLQHNSATPLMTPMPIVTRTEQVVE